MLPDPALLWPFLLGFVLGVAAAAEPRRARPSAPARPVVLLPDVQVHIIGTPRPALTPYRVTYDALRRN